MQKKIFPILFILIAIKPTSPNPTNTTQIALTKTTRIQSLNTPSWALGRDQVSSLSSKNSFNFPFFFLGICLGMKFGVTQVKGGIVAILSKYNVVPFAKTEIPFKFDKSTFNFQPENGVWLKFVKREKVVNEE